MEQTSRDSRLKVVTIIPVWVVAVVGAVVVGLTSPGDHYLIWLPLVLGACILITFGLQLSTQEKDGLVDRATLSLAGSLVILGIATGILSLAAL